MFSLFQVLRPLIISQKACKLFLFAPVSFNALYSTNRYSDIDVDPYRKEKNHIQEKKIQQYTVVANLNVYYYP
jgi:hypothetical protein